eukprot:6736846-Pyramimonas_sp.AAC.2
MRKFLHGESTSRRLSADLGQEIRPRPFCAEPSAENVQHMDARAVLRDFWQQLFVDRAALSVAAIWLQTHAAGGHQM